MPQGCCHEPQLPSALMQERQLAAATAELAAARTAVPATAWPGAHHALAGAAILAASPRRAARAAGAAACSRGGSPSPATPRPSVLCPDAAPLACAAAGFGSPIDSPDASPRRLTLVARAGGAARSCHAACPWRTSTGEATAAGTRTGGAAAPASHYIEARAWPRAPERGRRTPCMQRLSSRTERRCASAGACFAAQCAAHAFRALRTGHGTACNSCALVPAGGRLKEQAQAESTTRSSPRIHASQVYDWRNGHEQRLGPGHGPLTLSAGLLAFGL